MIRSTTEAVFGSYGAMAVRGDTHFPMWSCYDGDYHYLGVVDDFGNIVQVTPATNLRGY